MNIKRITLLLLLSCLYLQGNAQVDTDLRFENFTGRYNFSKESKSTIIRDKRGYVWLGGNGLYRFDGSRVTHYANFSNQDHGLRENYISDLVNDANGRLWIGSNGGLCYFDEDNGKFNYLNTNSGNIQYAYAFYLDKNDLWFVSNLGLCRLDIQTENIYLSSLNNIVNPWMTFPVDEETLLISTLATNYYLYNKRTNTYREEKFFASDNAVRIKQMLRIADRLLMATNKGLWIYNKEQSRLLNNTSPFFISAIQPYSIGSNDSLAWLGTGGNGLLAYNFISEKIQAAYNAQPNDPFSLESNSINQLHVDNNKLLWIATDAGFTLLNPHSQSYRTKMLPPSPYPVNDNYVMKVMEDKFNPAILWLCSAYPGLLQIDRRSKQVLRSFDLLKKSGRVRDAIQLNAHEFLLLTSNKLTWYDINTRQVKKTVLVSQPDPNLVLRKLIITNNAEVFITSNKGLYHFSGGLKPIEPVAVNINSKQVSEWSLKKGVFDSLSNCLWIATDRGLLQYRPLNNEKRFFANTSTADTTKGNIINDIRIMESGEILFASMMGIGIFNPATSGFREVYEFGNIRAVPCFGVHSKGNTVWINSSAGLIKYDLISKKTSIRSIESPYTDAFSVLPLNVVHEEIVLGLRNAYAYIPLQIDDNRIPPSQPVIETVLVNQQPFSPSNSGSHFHPGQNNFSFRFTAFEYITPGDIRFRYRLRGAGDEWRMAGPQREIQFSGLPGGDYTFEIQSGNSSNEWNDQIASFRFTIDLPLWKRTWFQLLLSALFIALVTGIANWRIRRIRRREELKTITNKKMAELETKLLRSQMNPHFIFNSLNSIQKYIWEQKAEDASEYLVRFSKLIRAILEYSTRDFISLKEELDTLKIYIELEHRRSNGHFDYDIRINQDIDQESTAVPPLFIQPYVENAIWHGLNKKDERGKLEINIQKTGKQLTCTIDDDGVGRKKIEGRAIPSDNKQASLGMEITRQRIEALQNEFYPGTGIEIIDKEINGLNAGTTIIIRLPLKEI